MNTMTKTPQKDYFITPKESNTISIYRIILTFLVIFLHSYTEQVNLLGNSITFDTPMWFWTTKYVISQIIARCAVPGFFFLSAILLYRNEFSWKENIIKKIRTLVIPYLILNTLWIFVYWIAQQISFLSRFFSQEGNIVANWNFLNWVDQYIGYTGYPLLYPLWFIRDLFVLNLLAVIIKRIIDRVPEITFIFLTIILIFNLKTNLFFLSANNLVYFSLGYYIVKYKVSLEKIKQLKLWFILSMYAFSIFLDYISRDFNLHYLFRNISIIIGIMFWFKISFIIVEKNISNIILKISKYSFFIYCFHEMSLSILKKLMAVILPVNVSSQVFQYISIPVIITLCCILLAKIMEKFLPSIYKVITGARIK